MHETFWLELTDRERRWLRRYSHDDCPAMPGAFSYHEAMVQIEDGPFGLERREGDEESYHYNPDPGSPEFCHDQRWLEIAHCACGYEFTTADRFQVHATAVYRRADTGEGMTIRDAPPGALWSSWWMPERWQGDDGLSITCKLPGGHDWIIDGIASNCTRPSEPHHCWVRHGTFGDRLTVDKNGNTCAAGGGSIQTKTWHGFLTAGVLRSV